MISDKITTLKLNLTNVLPLNRLISPLKISLMLLLVHAILRIKLTDSIFPEALLLELIHLLLLLHGLQIEHLDLIVGSCSA